MRRAESLERLGIRMTRMRARDLVGESVLSMVRHPRRSLLTVMGVVLSAMAFVLSLGLSDTASRQVSSSFDVRRATEVLVQSEEGSAPPGECLDRDRIQRVEGLNGVVHTGRRALLGEQPLRRTVRTSSDPVATPIIAADPGALLAMAPRIRIGRDFDQFHADGAVPVILLSAPIAHQLAITRVGVSVFLDNRPYTVLGIYDDVQRRPEAMASAIIPYSVSEQHRTGAKGIPKRDVLIETAPGAAQLIARQAPTALCLEAPATLRSLAPPDPRTLRNEVESSVTRSTVMLSAVALLIGTVAIGQAASTGVAARAGEIGLRRALGGRRRHIFAQLLAETVALGTIGGILGTASGILGVSVVALANGWAPVLDIRSAIIACAASAASGLLAGFLPAFRASRIQPVQALQR